MRELSRLRELRRVVREVAAALAPGSRPSPKSLAELSRTAAEAARHARLRVGSSGAVVRSIDVRDSRLAAVRYRIADAAVSLLTGDAAARLKACPTCGWVFLDVSKNRSRRWCSMSTCGSVDKARRYYRRKKAARK
jgi:predicted RNA-binding Zn ribbon-like protein